MKTELILSQQQNVIAMWPLHQTLIRLGRNAQLQWRLCIGAIVSSSFLAISSEEKAFWGNQLDWASRAVTLWCGVVAAYLQNALKWTLKALSSGNSVMIHLNAHFVFYGWWPDAKKVFAMRTYGVQHDLRTTGNLGIQSFYVVSTFSLPFELTLTHWIVCTLCLDVDIEWCSYLYLHMQMNCFYILNYCESCYVRAALSWRVVSHCLVILT